MNASQPTRRRRALVFLVGAATVSSLLVAAPAVASSPDDGRAATAEQASARRVTYLKWIRVMNRKADMSGSDFIRTYSTPQYFDWSSDGCSVPGPIPESRFGFKWACYRHDFGYRNLKRAQVRYGRNTWRWHNKAVADTQFLEDMQLHCRLNWSGDDREDCYEDAAVYYWAVSTFGDFDSTFRHFRPTYRR